MVDNSGQNSKARTWWCMIHGRIKGGMESESDRHDPSIGQQSLTRGVHLT